MVSVYTLCVWEEWARVAQGSEMTPQESLKNHKSYQLETFQAFRPRQYETFEQKKKKKNWQLDMLFLSDSIFDKFWLFLAFFGTFIVLKISQKKSQSIKIKFKKIQGCSSYRKKNYEQKTEGGSYLTRVNRIIIEK